MSCSWPYFERPAFWMAISMASSTSSRSMPFSRATTSATWSSSMRGAVAVNGIVAMPLPSLSCLLAARGGQQLVRQHQPRLDDRVVGQLGGAVVAERDLHPAFLHAEEPAAEAAASCERHARLGLDLEAR